MLFSVALFALFFGNLQATIGLEYDEELARRLVHFSAAVYCIDDKVFGGTGFLDVVNDWECDTCGFIDESSTIISVYGFSKFADVEGMITYDSENDAITVSFAGTDPSEFEDILVDAAVWRSEYQGDCKSDYWWVDDCTVHTGFYFTYKIVRDLIYNEVLRLRQLYPSSKLEITGHSLGGAMAILCALDLVDGHDISIQPTYVYTFGQPRVGDNEFGEYYEEKVGSDITFRVTHAQDIVPLIAPNFAGYRHFGQEIYYEDDPDGDFIICDASGNENNEDPNCISQHNWAIVLLQVVDSLINDHLNYLNVKFLIGVLECNTGLDIDGDGNNAGGQLPGFNETEWTESADEDETISDNGGISDDDVSTESPSDPNTPSISPTAPPTYEFSGSASFSSGFEESGESFVSSLSVILDWSHWGVILHTSYDIAFSETLREEIETALQQAIALTRIDIEVFDDVDVILTGLTRVEVGSALFDVDSDLESTYLELQVSFESDSKRSGFEFDLVHIVDFFSVALQHAWNLESGSSSGTDRLITQHSTSTADDWCWCADLTSNSLEGDDEENNNSDDAGTKMIIAAVVLVFVIVFVAVLLYYKKQQKLKEMGAGGAGGKEKEGSRALSDNDGLRNRNKVSMIRVKTMSPLGSPVMPGSPNGTTNGGAASPTTSHTAL